MSVLVAIDPVRLWVPGRPQTAGSKTAVPTAAGARVIEAGSKASRAAKRSWRGDLRDAAARALDGREWDACQPMTLRCVFVRARPATHLSASGAVKDRFRDAHPVQRPDTTKLLRAAEDALTGVLWLDDAQIVEQRAWKAYGDQCGIEPRTEGLYVGVGVADLYRGPMVETTLALRRVDA